jgi:hypothetical protein
MLHATYKLQCTPAAATLCRFPAKRLQAHHRRRQARPAAPAAPASPANGTSKVWVPTGRIMAVEAAGCATASAAAPKTTATAPLQHVKTAASKIMAVSSGSCWGC